MGCLRQRLAQCLSFERGAHLPPPRVHPALKYQFTPRNAICRAKAASAVHLANYCALCQKDTARMRLLALTAILIVAVPVTLDGCGKHDPTQMPVAAPSKKE